MEKIILEELVKLNNCFGKLSEKVDNLDKKIDDIDKKFDKRIDELDKKIDDMDKKFEKKTNNILIQFGDSLEIIDEMILKSKQEILSKFEEQNHVNEIRFQKIENDIVQLKKYIN